jgi:lipoyl(octanoyl) transferase
MCPGTLEIKNLGLSPYEESLQIQKELVVSRRSGGVPDQLLLQEHPHVITMGKSAPEEHIIMTKEQLDDHGIRVFHVGRGGDVTYHGPGQLVGYPILDLKPDRKDLHRYLRDLEEVLIRSLSALSVRARRRDN